jgi:hypothetical protein
VLSARGYASTAGAPNLFAYATEARIIAIAIP